MFWLTVSIIAARVVIEAVFFAIGASIFSFLNVVIYRLPKRMGFVEGKSMCPSCKHTLEAKDLIPIISWISLKGRCRYCGCRISARYTVVEVLGGVTAVAATLLLGIKWHALAAFLIVGTLTVAACIIYDSAVKNKGE